MKKQLQVSDRIYFNQSILIDDERLIYGVPGREAFHIFDLHQRDYVKSIAELGYTTLLDQKNEDEAS